MAVAPGFSPASRIGGSPHRRPREFTFMSAGSQTVLFMATALLFSCMAKASLRVGDSAPDFALPDQHGTMVKLSDFRGKKNVVLAFYIKAATPG